MYKRTTYLLIALLGLSGCVDSDIDPKVKRILNEADMSLIEVHTDEPIEVFFIATVNGTDTGPNGRRMVTNSPLILESHTMIGIQTMSPSRLGVFASAGGTYAINWILDDIGPVGGTLRSISGKIANYTGGPHLLYHQYGNPSQGSPRIQIFMVSDLSTTPFYDSETNVITEVGEDSSNNH